MGREKNLDSAANMFRSLTRKSTRKKPWQERLKADNLYSGSEKTEDEDKEDGEEEGEAEKEEDAEEEEKKKDDKKSLKVQNMSTLKVFQIEVPMKYLTCPLGCPCLSVFNLCSSPWQSVLVWVSMNPYISLGRNDLLWDEKITGGSEY